MKFAVVVALLLLVAGMVFALYFHLTKADSDEVPPLPHGYIGDYAGAPKTEKTTDPLQTGRPTTATDSSDPDAGSKAPADVQ